jgi:outer membrane biosynthesis protein TonB
LRQVQPALAGTRWKVPVTTRVAVVVSVDARGFVTDAQPQVPAKGTSLYLEGLCLNAARQWTFKPATVHGKPVAGKYQIEFVFRPQ